MDSQSDDVISRKRKLDQVVPSTRSAGSCSTEALYGTPQLSISPPNVFPNSTACGWDTYFREANKSRFESDVRDQYQFNMAQIQTAYQSLVVQLEAKLNASEKHRWFLTDKLHEKEEEIQKMKSVYVELSDIRRVDFTGQKPPRMCICGSYTTSMVDLSPGVMEQIFRHIDSLSKQKLRRVCQSWKTMIDSVEVKSEATIDVTTIADHYPKTSKTTFLQLLYEKCLGPETLHLTFDAGKERLELWDGFDLDDNNISETLSSLCPNLKEITFKRMPLGWNHILSLPESVERVNLVDVDLMENSGLISFVHYINTYETGVHVARSTLELKKDKIGSLINVMQTNATRIKKSEKKEIIAGILTLSTERQKQIVALIQRREPGVKHKPELNWRKFTEQHLKMFKPWTKLGILAIVRSAATDILVQCVADKPAAPS